MTENRPFRWATTSTRLLGGMLVAAAFAVAVATGVALTWPAIATEPVAIVATPAPEASVLVCDGPLLALGRDAAQADAVTVAAAQVVTVGVAAGSAEPAQATLAAPAEGGGPLVLTAQPDGRTRTDVAAAGAASVSADDLAGYSASACRPPLLESWLVAGATTTGSADLLLLSNPGVVAATVEVTVYGTDGPDVPPGGQLSIGPGTQRVIPLSGLALGEASPVLRISATGAPIAASLQSSLTRTLVPGGVDQSGPVASPAGRLQILGVPVTQATEDGDAATVVRVLSPSADTVATITATPIGGGAARAPVTVPLEAGKPVEAGLDGLAAGEYTITVDAGAPVVAAAWQTTGFGEGADFAWYTPAPAVTVASLVAVPVGGSAALFVANETAADVTVALDAVDGSSSTEITVPAGATSRLGVRGGTTYVLDSGGADVRAAVSLRAGGGIAGYPVWAADTAAKPITVYP